MSIVFILFLTFLLVFRPRCVRLEKSDEFGNYSLFIYFSFLLPLLAGWVRFVEGYDRLLGCFVEWKLVVSV